MDVRDIDFDGSEDFGVLCDTTHNEAHCWFVWDEASGSFRYLTTLGGRLEVLPETGQLVEAGGPMGLNPSTTPSLQQPGRTGPGPLPVGWSFLRPRLRH